MGSPYNQTIALTGGTPSFQCSVCHGPIISGWEVGRSVPDGPTLNAMTGADGYPCDRRDERACWWRAPKYPNQSNRAAEQSCSFSQPTASADIRAPGGAGLTLQPAGFVFGATVDFKDAPLTTTLVESEQLSAAIPAADIASAILPGNGDGTFTQTSGSPYPVGHGPVAIAAADFNRDGKLDLAVANSMDGAVSILLQPVDGSIQRAVLARRESIILRRRERATPHSALAHRCPLARQGMSKSSSGIFWDFCGGKSRKGFSENGVILTDVPARVGRSKLFCGLCSAAASAWPHRSGRANCPNRPRSVVEQTV